MDGRWRTQVKRGLSVWSSHRALGTDNAGTTVATTGPTTGPAATGPATGPAILLVQAVVLPTTYYWSSGFSCLSGVWWDDSRTRLVFGSL